MLLDHGELVRSPAGSAAKAVVEPIANTTTHEGLSIQVELDKNDYPTGVEVSDEELAAMHIRRSRFHGDWNYVVPASDRISCYASVLNALGCNLFRVSRGARVQNADTTALLFYLAYISRLWWA